MSMKKQLCQIVAILVATCGPCFAASSHTASCKTETFLNSTSGYLVSLSSDWVKVTDPLKIQKMALWCYKDYPETLYSQFPTENSAWENQTALAYLTINATRADNPPFAQFVFSLYNLKFLEKKGWKCAETGETSVQNETHKWSLYAIPNNLGEQYWLIFHHDEMLYTICVTGKTISPALRVQIDKILTSFSFLKRSSPV